MFETKVRRPSSAFLVQSLFTDRTEINRLFAAAVVSQPFRDLLLRDPVLAIENGYQDERFSFSKAELDFIVSIQANSLAELASQVANSFDLHKGPIVKVPAQPIDYFYR